MADIVTFQTNNIRSGTYGDSSATSCAGVPGTGSLSAAYCQAYTTVTTALDSDGYLWFCNTDGYVRQSNLHTSIAENVWVCPILIRRSALTLTYGGSYGTITDLYGSELKQKTIFKESGISGYFDGISAYDIPRSLSSVPDTATASSLGYWNSGWTVDDLSLDSDNNATFYVGYPIYYATSLNADANSSDDPVTFSLVPFTFNFQTIVEALDYYPFAIYNSGWQSCNRSGGALKKYSGSAWNDLKNRESNASDSTVFNYSGSSWDIAPLIGSV